MSRGAEDFLEDIQLVDFHRILVPEGRRSDEEFEEQNTESPPVDGSTMPYPRIRTTIPLRNKGNFIKAPAKTGFTKLALPELRITSGARYSGVPQRV